MPYKVKIEAQMKHEDVNVLSEATRKFLDHLRDNKWTVPDEPFGGGADYNGLSPDEEKAAAEPA